MEDTVSFCDGISSWYVGQCNVIVTCKQYESWFLGPFQTPCYSHDFGSTWFQALNLSRTKVGLGETSFPENQNEFDHICYLFIIYATTSARLWCDFSTVSKNEPELESCSTGELAVLHDFGAGCFQTPC